MERDLRWVALEPSGETLWQNVRAAVTRLLTSEWQQGLIEGATREQAFYVRCGRETMTAEDIATGRVVLDIGISVGASASMYTMQVILQANAGT